MEREIKFRAWDSYQNKMYEWDEIIKMNSDGHLTLSNLLNEWTFHIKPLEYTGLKDKNGKEIYEGDILFAKGQENFYIQVIEFHNTYETSGRGWIGRNIWESDYEKTLVKRIDNVFSYFDMPHGEIIGNIYENSELLKG